MTPPHPSPSPRSALAPRLARLRWLLVPLGVMLILLAALWLLADDRPLARFIYGPW